MWPFTSSSQSYAPTKPDNDIEGEQELDRASSPLTSPPSQPRQIVLFTASLLAFVFLLLGIGLILHSTLSHTSPLSTTLTSNTPLQPGLRREWRTLTQPEKQHYITSVQCLLTHPSIFATHAEQNSTLYEDFPYIHSHVGYYTHNSASFLPWHRYFLHIYETTLRSACGFTGELTYWDWTLDWEDLAHAPVFDAKTGFGTDGDPQGEVTVGKTGRCVVDGPFANVTASFFDVKYQPHCLSRGFVDDAGTLGHIDGAMVSPESIEKVMQLDNYEMFVAKMESMVHDIIPFGIGGDFWTFTAPYDPLFYLHHTQLDRLWYMWQQRDPENRLMAYNGHDGRHSIGTAKLTDQLKMQGLAPSIPVEQVMSTDSDFLQYRY